jgi:hypothetical protein
MATSSRDTMLMLAKITHWNPIIHVALSSNQKSLMLLIHSQPQMLQQLVLMYVFYSCLSEFTNMDYNDWSFIPLFASLHVPISTRMQMMLGGKQLGRSVMKTDCLKVLVATTSLWCLPRSTRLEKSKHHCDKIKINHAWLTDCHHRLY